MTGLGTDACTVTLTTTAPSGGLIVNLSSSGSAVTVPNTVTVKAGAVSAGFTAMVYPLATAQAVTMTASAGGVVKNFAIQLNAAILALSISATNVAFGDVVVNTSATQPVMLTSIGILPVTINGETITGTGFTLPGAALPSTLSPGQQVILNIEFDPTAVGPATGQLTIASTSSTNNTASVSLSGTGTAQGVAVAVTPTAVSITTGATQQFTASVTGTSNTAVTWRASGTGCSVAACGTISSSGLYAAPAVAPSPASVTITASSVADTTKSTSAAVTIAPPAGTTYYLAPASAGGNDANNGLSSSAPWLTPNHSVNCGDVILAAPSVSYSSTNFETGSWGAVSCPGGNNVAWLKCATFDSCKITASSGQPGFYVDQSYWGVQGWEVTALDSTSNWCFGAAPSYAAPGDIHHIIFANDVANGCQQGGFTSFSLGSSVGVDYFAVVGTIAYNSTQSSLNCYSGISIYHPKQSDSLPGTHIYVAGNFSWGNFNPNPCAGGTPTDGDGIIFDTFDWSGAASQYQQQGVADNNILIANGGRGLIAAYNRIGTAPLASIYFRHNTLWGNNEDTHQNSTYCGELTLYKAFNVQAFLNSAATNSADGCGNNPKYAYSVLESATTTNHIYESWAYAASGTNGATNNSAGFSFGPNNALGVNPAFSNASVPGAPRCGSATSVPNCMKPVVEDFTPTNAAAKIYGYQIPSSTPAYDPLFPRWLCNVNLPSGLVTMGCATGP